MIATTKTVREVVLELPLATQIFEQLKIDYCCGGEKSLAEACVSAGVDIEKVQRMLDDAKQKPGNAALDFQKATLAELVAHILEKHHAYTKQELARLPALFEKVLAAHGSNHPELEHADEVFTHLCVELEPHLFKEEQILFPYILALEAAVTQKRVLAPPPFGTVKNPVRMMMMEHDVAGELLRELRKVTSDYAVPSDACTSFTILYQSLEAFEQDLHQHIHLENNVLFPKAIQMEEGMEF